MSLTAKNISVQNFRLYGKVIHYPNREAKGRVRNLWRIVHREKAKVGWRVAYLVLRDKSIGRLECHPFSDETLEPVRGKTLLFVAARKDLAAVRCFHLDRPVILRKGVWHGLVSVTPEADIKITENAAVACRYWPLGFRVKSWQDLSRRIIPPKAGNLA